MRSASFAFMLLSLFTTEQRAAEIEGDLIEESEYRGEIWFFTHVFHTTLALFAASFKQAPVRISVLAVVAAGLCVMTCDVGTRAFFGADAYVPLPFLGMIAVFSWAFLIGYGLGYLAPGLGVRAATFTIVLLMLLLVVTQTLAPSEQLANHLEVGAGMPVLNAFVSFVLTFGAYAFSTAIFLTSLMTGSVYACRQSSNLH